METMHEKQVDGSLHRTARLRNVLHWPRR